MVGLVDCNNFFVSCERVFAPHLQGRPVVVLSNNDGCVIARSNEAKALGIPMGEPFFRIRKLADSGKIEVLSSNLELYRDMSHRVMSLVRKNFSESEVYSIDEAFFTLGNTVDEEKTGRMLRACIGRCTGIPVSVGIAPTKTLAKMASHFAKKYAGYKGCCLIDTDEKRQKALSLYPLGEVWGIGRRYAARFQTYGLRTAADFAAWNERRVQCEMGITGVRIWKELHGLPCLPLEQDTLQKSITMSRSFSKALTTLDELRPLVADFASLAADKARRQKARAYTLSVYIRTDRFRPDVPQYSNVVSETLEVPSADPRELIAVAGRCLERAFRPGFGYKKAGVTLSGLVNGSVQGMLFDTVDREKQHRLLTVYDAIRQKNGKRTLQIAAQGDINTMMNRQFRSRRFTTCLDDVIEVSP